MRLLFVAWARLGSLLRNGNVDTLASVSLWSSAALAVGIIIACLWPFHQPKNGVDWLGWRNGVRIKGHGALMSEAPQAFAIAGEAAVSFEIWVAPDADDDSDMILTYWNPKDHGGFSIFQSHSALLLQVQAPGSAGSRRDISSVTSSRFFKLGDEVLVAVTFGEHGAAIYANGVLINRFPQFKLPGHALAGRLVIGSEPQAGDSWYGKFLGFAAFARELTPEEIRRHTQEWNARGRPAVQLSDACTALYAFDERSGGRVGNSTHGGANLVIPARYQVVDKEILPPVWRELTSEWWYWEDALINVAGFAPFGLALCALFTYRGWASGIFPVVIACAFLSLSVELLQGFLATRDSSTTDVLSNTIGGLVGAALWRKVYASAMATRSKREF